jgi:hypothetical protein
MEPVLACSHLDPVREGHWLRDLTAACTELADQLAIFKEPDITNDRADAGLPTIGWLVVDQDVEPSVGRSGVPATRTPGNTAAINAQMDAHEMIRRLEAALRVAVAGHSGRARGGSDKNTLASLKAIQNLGAACSRVMTVTAAVTWTDAHRRKPGWTSRRSTAAGSWSGETAWSWDSWVSSVFHVVFVSSEKSGATTLSGFSRMSRRTPAGACR